MTKYNFQFKQDKGSLRPCRLVITMTEYEETFIVRRCIAMNDECEGKLYDRPEWCPLTVVEDDKE